MAPSNILDNSSASSEHHQPVQYQGHDYQLVTSTQAEARKGSACMTNYKATFYLRCDDEDDIEIGETFGVTVGKECCEKARRSRHAPAPYWCKELLTTPGAYLGDATLHGQDEAEDGMSDMQKVFQLLFDPAGKVKETVQSHAALLDQGSQIHYVHYYCLKKEFRGKKGFGQHAMHGYLESLKSVSQGLAFAGTVILPPAPLMDEWESEVKPGQESKTWPQKKARLILSYEKSGFKMIWLGDTEQENAISVMGLSTIAPPPGGTDNGTPSRSRSSSASSTIRVAMPPVRKSIRRVQTPKRGLKRKVHFSSSESESEASDSESGDYVPPPPSPARSMVDGWSSITRSGTLKRQILMPKSRRGASASELKNFKHPDDSLDAPERQTSGKYPWKGGWYGIDEHAKQEDIDWGWADYNAKKARRLANAQRAAQARATGAYSSRETYEDNPNAGPDPDAEHEVRNILNETQDGYEIDWEGTDASGNPHPTTWHPMEHVNDDAQERWEQEKAMGREGNEEWSEDN